ncbi:MAG: FliI/YscN family ATPase [Candidatus Omnitrophica bacterium]|nr:FliI/YscN family ATPase [Candidatus Omnitrophota bacterium]
MIEAPRIDWDLFRHRVETCNPILQNGRVEEIIGLVIESRGPAGSVGDLCEIKPGGNGERTPAEIVGFRRGKTLLMPLGEVSGISPGDEVISRGDLNQVAVGESLLGRVVDGLGVPMDGHGPILARDRVPILNTPTEAMQRRRVTEVLPTGVKAIDGLVTLGEGQRMGIFAGSGVGKSTLLGMIAKFTQADVNVVALVGERSREVREFIERDLGEEGLARTVVVVATSDRSSLVRIRAALRAMAIAEWFRDRGNKVMFMMDSVTRLAMAQREVGLAIGEPPTTRGYTPSVFTLLPKFLERCGTSAGEGSITGLITVLVEGDDLNEPISDAVRGILDGHIVLTRRLADRNHFPSIDVLRSISRVANDITDGRQQAAAAMVRSRMASYEEMEDLINLGAYRQGTNPEVDDAIAAKPKIDQYTKQSREQGFDFGQVRKQLVELVGGKSEAEK